MTTYDDLYNYFKRNIKVDEFDYPDTQEGIASLVEDAKIEFNIRLKKKVLCNNILEQLSVDLTDGEMLFFMECMKLITLKNMLTDFVSLWETFQNDIGRRYYREQKSGREKLVEDQERRLSRLALMISDEYEEV